MVWIIDTCVEVSSQGLKKNVFYGFLNEHLKRRGRIAGCRQCVTELLEVESKGLLDYALTFYSDFDRLGLIDTFSFKKLQREDIREFDRLSKIKQKLLDRLDKKCRDEVEEDWHLIAMAIHFDIPIVTTERLVIEQCVCPIPASEREISRVCWVRDDLIAEEEFLLKVSATDDLRPNFTVGAICEQLNLEV